VKTVTIYPAINVGFASGGLFIEAPEPLRNNALILLFIVPDRTFGPVHHFIGTDDAIMAPVQETFKKERCWLSRVIADFF